MYRHSYSRSISCCVSSHSEVTVPDCEQKRDKTAKIPVKHNEILIFHLGAFENPSVHDLSFFMNFLTVTCINLILDEYDCTHLFTVCAPLFRNSFSQTCMISFISKLEHTNWRQHSNSAASYTNSYTSEHFHEILKRFSTAFQSLEVLEVRSTQICIFFPDLSTPIFR